MPRIKHILKQKVEHDIWTVKPHDLVYNAIKIMSDHNIGALLVVDQAEAVGILSERDYARKTILENRSSRATKVSEIMTHEVLYVVPTDSAEECLALMTEKRIRHLPVMEGDEILGFISMGDLVKAIVSDREYVIDQLTRYITDSYSHSSVPAWGHLQRAVGE